MLNDVGAGITIGSKKTIKAPNGERVVAVAVKLVPQGIALGMFVEGAQGKTEYQATFDSASLMQLFAVGNYYIMKAIGRKV